MTVRKSFCAAVVLLMVVFAATAVAPAVASAKHRETQLRPLDAQVFSAINAFRRAHGLAALRSSVALHRSARQHSLEMGADGYFDHASANGTDCFTRIARYFGRRGYTSWSVGENLLWSTPSLRASAALDMWISSPGHLRNLLDPTFRSLGVSAVHVTRAGGVYGGQAVTIITTDFGARR